jgi:hypothetical protein
MCVIGCSITLACWPLPGVVEVAPEDRATLSDAFLAETSASVN